jgi:hypothetical protein
MGLSTRLSSTLSDRYEVEREIGAGELLVQSPGLAAAQPDDYVDDLQLTAEAVEFGGGVPYLWNSNL